MVSRAHGNDLGSVSLAASTHSHATKTTGFASNPSVAVPSAVPPYPVHKCLPTFTCACNLVCCSPPVHPWTSVVRHNQSVLFTVELSD